MPPKQQALLPWEEQPKKKKTNFYNKYDLTSLLIKSMRLWDEQLAIKTMRCMLQEWVTETYIARKCVHFASEDAVGMDIFCYTKDVHDWIRDCWSEVNSLSRCIIALCRAPKFRETRKEWDREVRRIRIREETKKQYQTGVKPFDVPERVYDIYTARWKAAYVRGENVDVRYSGVLQGWIHMRKQFLSQKKLDPTTSAVSDAYSVDILECTERCISYDERMDEKTST